ncbi:PREDICTED: glutamate-rich protein 1 [Elephantulus edwardii]|uniref:glutamate-rich protein 1 n=1 Tax=Elephantulus edwardii TaxID=28737 RepID=UPI0003F0BE98|nr:PREDICTED: glutamate-rich protein 1 [Elephantulus edwardii]
MPDSSAKNPRGALKRELFAGTACEKRQRFHSNQLLHEEQGQVTRGQTGKRRLPKKMPTSVVRRFQLLLAYPHGGTSLLVQNLPVPLRENHGKSPSVGFTASEKSLDGQVTMIHPLDNPLPHLPVPRPICHKDPKFILSIDRVQDGYLGKVFLLVMSAEFLEQDKAFIAALMPSPSFSMFRGILKMSVVLGVFVEKVLKKLFPHVPSGQEELVPVTGASEKPPEKITPQKAKLKRAHPLTGDDTQIQPERRVYTVSLPPTGYVPCLPESNTSLKSENSCSSDDIEDEEPREQPRRKRIRKHRSKKCLKNSTPVFVKQVKLEEQQSLLPEKLQPKHTDGPTISKNKKRKLKKKQQIKKKKAAGLLTKASGINFMYQPEESTSEQEELGNTDREGDEDTKEENVEDLDEEDVRDAEEEVQDGNEEDVKSANEKADSILNFLKSTQEIYFYDGISKGSDSTLSTEATEELFKHLESHSMSPSDVFILDHLKTLLLLQDTERLKNALEIFPEHCMMSFDHARVISTFFNYWITDILPERNSE